MTTVEWVGVLLVFLVIGIGAYRSVHPKRQWPDWYLEEMRKAKALKAANRGVHLG